MALIPRYRCLCLFLTIIIANATDKTDNIVAMRNIRLYAMALGNTPVAAVPPIFSICCWDCINIPAIAGPMALPTILIRLLG